MKPIRSSLCAALLFAHVLLGEICVCVCVSTTTPYSNTAKQSVTSLSSHEITVCECLLVCLWERVCYCVGVCAQCLHLFVYVLYLCIYVYPHICMCLCVCVFVCLSVCVFMFMVKQTEDY